MRIVALIAFVLVTQAVFGADDIKEIIQKGIEARNAVNKFTTNDVPEKWRTKVEDWSTNNYTKKVYSRGGQKILEVSWKNEWTGIKTNMFTATVFDGEKKIGKVICFSDATVSVYQTKDTRNDYDMITSIKTNGLATVMFTGESNYMQVVELRGRNTRLIDDLEYTKSAMMIDQAVEPLIEAIKGGPGKSAKVAK